MKKILAVLALFITLYPTAGYGAMSSTNYYIFSDSINVGGIYSTGGTYILQDTLGEGAVGTSTGGSYSINAGYQAMERGYITLSLGSNTINLNTLSAGAVASDNTSVTVSTDSATGYSLSVGDFTGAGLPSITSGGSVTAGVSGIGLSVSGAQSATSADIALSPSGEVLAFSNTPIDNSQTTVTVKAAINSAFAANSYSQQITLTASANL